MTNFPGRPPIKHTLSVPVEKLPGSRYGDEAAACQRMASELEAFARASPGTMAGYLCSLDTSASLGASEARYEEWAELVASLRSGQAEQDLHRDFDDFRGWVLQQVDVHLYAREDVAGSQGKPGLAADADAPDGASPVAPPLAPSPAPQPQEERRAARPASRARNGKLLAAALMVPFAVPAACIVLADRFLPATPQVKLQVEIAQASRASDGHARLVATAATTGTRYFSGRKSSHVEYNPGMFIRNTSSQAISRFRYRVDFITPAGRTHATETRTLAHPLVPGEEVYLDSGLNKHDGDYAKACFTFFEGRAPLLCAPAPMWRPPVGPSVSPQGAGLPAAVEFTALTWHRPRFYSSEQESVTGGVHALGEVGPGTIYLALYADDGQLETVMSLPLARLARDQQAVFAFEKLKAGRKTGILSFEQAGMAVGYR